MAPPSRTSELLDGVRRAEHGLATGFARYDERQAQFKRKFAQETRKHSQLICDSACATIASSTSVAALLFAQHDVSDGDHRVDKELATHQGSLASAKADYEVLRGLAPFYMPSSEATELICDDCGGFRGATLVQPLPAPWQEFQYDVTGKRYFFHMDDKTVRWRPPPGTNPLSVLVFERTNSVATVCRCAPSIERRRRLMQKFREFALRTAREEAEKRDRNLRGAFTSLAMSLVAKDPG